MSFKVELGVESYRIVGPNGEEGELANYNAIATLRLGNEIYYCDATENPSAEEQFVERVLTSQQETTNCEDVIFDGEESEEDEEADEEEDSSHECPC